MKRRDQVTDDPFAEYNAGIKRARDAYYGNDAAEYARRIKASEKSKRRYRARKDSSK